MCERVQLSLPHVARSPQKPRVFSLWGLLSFTAGIGWTGGGFRPFSPCGFGKHSYDTQNTPERTCQVWTDPFQSSFRISRSCTVSIPPSPVGLWVHVCNPRCAQKIEWYRGENHESDWRLTLERQKFPLSWQHNTSHLRVRTRRCYGRVAQRTTPRFVTHHGPGHILQTRLAHHHALSVPSSPWYLSIRLKDTVDVRPGRLTEHPLPLRTPTLTFTAPQQRRSNITNTTFDSAEHPCL